MKRRIEQLGELVKLQCVNGTWNFNSYHFGMANGLILALAVMKDEEPLFLEAPLQWLEDNLDGIVTEVIEVLDGRTKTDS